ncbi:MAG: type II secretion system secretin GspD [Methylococcales bacterium]|nr:type II secretion system secretin GspD [Methylococcales bacterium]
MSFSQMGCEALKPFTADKLPLNPDTKAQQIKLQDSAFKDLQNTPPISKIIKPSIELYPGTDHFVAESVHQHRATTPTGAGTYSLNFDDADLGEVAKVILSDILGQNYVLSPKVVGKVTLQTTEALSKEELIPTLEMVLRMNNAALVKDGRIYHIEPTAEALFVSNIASSKIGYQTRVIPVRNVAVQDVADIIKPLVHEKTILNVDGSRNIIVASGTADEIARVVDLVSTFDIDLLKGRSFGLFSLAHVDPDTVIKELEGIFHQKAKDDESAFFQFMPIQRLNAVLAVTHQGRYLKDIENWVFRLDRANTASGGGGVNVYKVQHANAEELANTLNEIFTGAQKKSTSAKVAPGQTAAAISNKTSSDTAAIDSTAAKSNTSSIAGKGTAKVANVDNVRIIADKANNAVVIVATAQEYAVIRPIIEQLDILPLQVLIDATIASVKLTDNLQYGIAWYLQHGSTTVGGAVGASPGTSIMNAGASAAAAVATGGLSAVYSSGAVNALLSTEAGKGNVNVMSSPSLMVLNNQKAKINVGDQVPIQTASTQLPTTSGTTTGLLTSNSIQYKDTGVTLEVTPRVNANGIVIMDVHQIVSSVIPVTSAAGIQSPTINKKEIDSSIAINDGETIVLGGLIDDNNAMNKSGIPLLYDLPWVGSLFGSTSYTRTKDELVVLITPRVVKSKQDSRHISDEFKRKLTGIYQKVSKNTYDTSRSLE